MIIAAILAITLDPAIRLLFHAHEELFVSPEIARARGKHPAGWQDSQRGKPPDKPPADEDLSSGRGVRA